MADREDKHYVCDNDSQHLLGLQELEQAVKDRERDAQRQIKVSGAKLTSAQAKEREKVRLFCSSLYQTYLLVAARRKEYENTVIALFLTTVLY